MIPTVPHSIVGETNRTYFAQSLVSPSRNIEGRNVASESRTLCGEVHANVNLFDSKRISIYKLTGTPPMVEHSLFISDNFHTILKPIDD